MKIKSYCRLDSGDPALKDCLMALTGHSNISVSPSMKTLREGIVNSSQSKSGKADFVSYLENQAQRKRYKRSNFSDCATP